MLHMNMALELDSTSLRINDNPKHGLAVDQLTPRGPVFDPHLGCRVVSLSKTHWPITVLYPWNIAALPTGLKIC